MSYLAETFDHHGYTVAITSHIDSDMGPPWKEHDGHGPVSDWTTRDKRPGEWVLHSDRHSKRYYDAAQATRIAKRDGWGLSEKALGELARQLGRPPTRDEIVAAAVRNNFDYLKGWCDNDWHWVGYTTRITAPDGTELDGDSCWGFDDEDYMLREAADQARDRIARHLHIATQTELATCWP